MASVTKRETPSGRIFWEVQTIISSGDKQKRQSKSFARKADAIAFAAKQGDLERRGIGNIDGLTFAGLANRALESWEARGELSAVSVDGYRHNLDTLCRQIGEIEISKLSPVHLDAALAALRKDSGSTRSKAKPGQPRTPTPLSGQSLLLLFRIGSKVLKQAVRWRLIDSNPFTAVEPPKGKKKPIKILTEAQGKRLYDKAVELHQSGQYPGLHVLVALLMVCGVRRSEVLGLAWDCVDLDNLEITIRRTVIKLRGQPPILRDEMGKSESSMRKITLPPELIPLLKTHRVWINEQIMAWGR
jgi:integrase